VVELALSRDEDSVTSLAISQSSETSITALAGINSSEADQRAGKNEHLRSFRLDHPAWRRGDDGSGQGIVKPAQYNGRTEALGQTALFAKPQGEKDGIYQRIVRVSPSQNASQRPVVAISTGLALQGEIVVFRTDSSLRDVDILGRINLGKEEATDIDIWAGEEADTAVLAYCTSLEVFFYVVSLSKASVLSEPISVYTVPAPEGFKSPIRPKLRALRFLSPRHILLLANRPQGSGADLIVLNLDRLGSMRSSTLQKRLHKSIKSATGLETCFLSTAPGAPASTGERQIVIAAAGQAGSIEILTIDYSDKKGVDAIQSQAVLRDTHPATITKIAFSTFIPPSSDTGKSQSRPQFVKLASISVGQTVVVHTLCLSPYPPTSSSQKNKAPKRYVLTGTKKQSEVLQNTFSIFMAILVIGIAAFLLQAFIEIRTGTNGYLGASSRWADSGFSDLMGPASGSPHSSSVSISATETASSSSTDSSDTLGDMGYVAGIATIPLPVLSALLSAPRPAHQHQAVPGHIVVIRHAEPVPDEANPGRILPHHHLSAELHLLTQPAKRHTDLLGHDWQDTLIRFEDLDQASRARWLPCLRDAGVWTDQQGEAALTGLYFSENVRSAIGAVERSGKYVWVGDKGDEEVGGEERAG
jgi:hypothetical protein